jgi:competence protein ComFC
VANPIRILLNTLLELFYPSNCVACGQPQDSGTLLCADCKARAPRIRPPFCRCCSRPFEGAIDGEFSCPNCEDRALAFDCVVSIYQAKGVLRDLILRFKYGGHFHLRRVLAGFLMEAMQDSRLQSTPIDCLVPVPLHPTRLRERGFNQAEALAEALSKQASVPVLQCIERRLYTNTQTRFDRMERMRNLRNAFAMRKNSNVHGKHLLLLDDVLTTGSTLHECALVLRAAGAESVRAVTVARG